MDPTAPAGFETMATVIPVLVGIVFVLVIATAVYRAVRMANRGQNPLTMQEDLVHRLQQTEVMSPRRTKAERLAELDGLLAAGTISAAEHGSARAAILAE